MIVQKKLLKGVYPIQNHSSRAQWKILLSQDEQAKEIKEPHHFLGTVGVSFKSGVNLHIK